MDKVKTELVGYRKSEDKAVFEYSVIHNNGSTSVEQPLVISSVDGLFTPAWTASIKLDDFPPQKSPADAANKMADWLERLGAALRSGVYPNFSPQKYTDLDS